jgi:1-acyl-sn-glycerol-3-phosphate acyltransferase
LPNKENAEAGSRVRTGSTAEQWSSQKGDVDLAKNRKKKKENRKKETIRWVTQQGMNIFVFNFVKLILRLSLPIYFSDIVVVGRDQIPKGEPVIFIGYEPLLEPTSQTRSSHSFMHSNHPNDFIDVVVIGCTCGRPVGTWGEIFFFFFIFILFYFFFLSSG